MQTVKVKKHRKKKEYGNGNSVINFHRPDITKMITNSTLALLTVTI